MKVLTAAVPACLLLVGLTATTSAPPQHGAVGLASRMAAAGHANDTNLIILRYCVVCHNDVANTGNLSLQTFDVGAAEQNAEVAEKMIRKLRAGMMPPPPMPRPGGDTLTILVTALETRLDEAAARNPNPGSRTFQRLNRA